MTRITGTNRFYGTPDGCVIFGISQKALRDSRFALLRTFFWMLLILELNMCRCDYRGQSMLSSLFVCLLQKGIIVFPISVLIESFLVLFSFSEILSWSSSLYSILCLFPFIPASCFLSLLVCSVSQVTSSYLIVPCHLSLIPYANTSWLIPAQWPSSVNASLHSIHPCLIILPSTLSIPYLLQHLNHSEHQECSTLIFEQVFVQRNYAIDLYWAEIALVVVGWLMYDGAYILKSAHEKAGLVLPL